MSKVRRQGLRELRDSRARVQVGTGRLKGHKDSGGRDKPGSGLGAVKGLRVNKVRDGPGSRWGWARG